MTKKHTIELTSTSDQSTMDFARKIGKHLKGGEVFELIGDLGYGKTTFVRGLAKGIGINDEVSSPSFTINNVYESKKIKIQHFDFYRINELGVLEGGLKEALADKTNVVITEWGQLLNGILPDKKIIIVFEDLGDNDRKLNISYTDNFKYLFDGLKNKRD